LIDLSSLAQTGLTQRLKAIIKTTVRITLAKLAKVKGESQMIQRAKGRRVPCVLQMRLLIGQQSHWLGIGSLCAAKKEVVTTGEGATAHAK
jgi:hypothetical protein